MLRMSRKPFDEADRWLQENDPAILKAMQRGRRNPRKTRSVPVKPSRDFLFKQENAHLKALPQGSTWTAHPSGNGLTISIPDRAPYWRKADGTIVR